MRPSQFLLKKQDELAQLESALDRIKTKYDEFMQLHAPQPHRRITSLLSQSLQKATQRHHTASTNQGPLTAKNQFQQSYSNVADLLGQKLGEDLAEEMRQVFEHYAGLGNPLAAGKLSLTQFFRFMEDHALFSKKLTRNKAQLEFLAKNPSKTMDFPMWVGYLARVAKEMFPWEPDEFMSLQQLAHSKILSQANTANESLLFSMKMTEVQQPDVQMLMTEQKPALLELFNMFRSEDINTADSLNMNDWLRFTVEMSFSPELASTPEVAHCYKGSCRGRMNFDQFLTALGLLALTMFSKKPYGDKYPTPVDKMEALFRWMEMNMQGNPIDTTGGRSRVD